MHVSRSERMPEEIRSSESPQWGRNMNQARQPAARAIFPIVPTLPVPTHWLCLALAVFTALQGCVTYAPKAVHEVPFLQRAQTQRDGDLQVTIAVPSQEESKALFGVSTYEKGIQPVWLQIENQSSVPYLLL